MEQSEWDAYVFNLIQMATLLLKRSKELLISGIMATRLVGGMENEKRKSRQRKKSDSIEKADKPRLFSCCCTRKKKKRGTSAESTASGPKHAVSTSSVSECYNQSKRAEIDNRVQTLEKQLLELRNELVKLRCCCGPQDDHVVKIAESFCDCDPDYAERGSETQIAETIYDSKTRRRNDKRSMDTLSLQKEIDTTQNCLSHLKNKLVSMVRCKNEPKEKKAPPERVWACNCDGTLDKFCCVCGYTLDGPGQEENDFSGTYVSQSDIAAPPALRDNQLNQDHNRNVNGRFLLEPYEQKPLGAWVYRAPTRTAYYTLTPLDEGIQRMAESKTTTTYNNNTSKGYNTQGQESPRNGSGSHSPRINNNNCIKGYNMHTSQIDFTEPNQESPRNGSGSHTPRINSNYSSKGYDMHHSTARNNHNNSNKGLYMHPSQKDFTASNQQSPRHSSGANTPRINNNHSSMHPSQKDFTASNHESPSHSSGSHTPRINNSKSSKGYDNQARQKDYTASNQESPRNNSGARAARSNSNINSNKGSGMQKDFTASNLDNKRNDSEMEIATHRYESNPTSLQTSKVDQQHSSHKNSPLLQSSRTSEDQQHIPAKTYQNRQQKYYKSIEEESHDWKAMTPQKSLIEESSPRYDDQRKTQSNIKQSNGRQERQGTVWESSSEAKEIRRLHSISRNRAQPKSGQNSMNSLEIQEEQRQQKPEAGGNYSHESRTRRLDTNSRYDDRPISQATSMHSSPSRDQNSTAAESYVRRPRSRGTSPSELHTEQTNSSRISVDVDVRENYPSTHGWRTTEADHQKSRNAAIDKLVINNCCCKKSKETRVRSNAGQNVPPKGCCCSSSLASSNQHNKPGCACYCKPPKCTAASQEWPFCESCYSTDQADEEQCGAPIGPSMEQRYLDETLAQICCMPRAERQQCPNSCCYWHSYLNTSPCGECDSQCPDRQGTEDWPNCMNQTFIDSTRAEIECELNCCPWEPCPPSQKPTSCSCARNKAHQSPPEICCCKAPQISQPQQVVYRCCPWEPCPPSQKPTSCSCAQNTAQQNPPETCCCEAPLICQLQQDEDNYCPWEPCPPSQKPPSCSCARNKAQQSPPETCCCEAPQISQPQQVVYSCCPWEPCPPSQNPTSCSCAQNTAQQNPPETCCCEAPMVCQLQQDEDNYCPWEPSPSSQKPPSCSCARNKAQQSPPETCCCEAPQISQPQQVVYSCCPWEPCPPSQNPTSCSCAQNTAQQNPPETCCCEAPMVCQLQQDEDNYCPWEQSPPSQKPPSCSCARNKAQQSPPETCCCEAPQISQPQQVVYSCCPWEPCPSSQNPTSCSCARNKAQQSPPETCCCEAPQISQPQQVVYSYCPWEPCPSSQNPTSCSCAQNTAQQSAPETCCCKVPLLCQPQEDLCCSVEPCPGEQDLLGGTICWRRDPDSCDPKLSSCTSIQTDEDDMCDQQSELSVDCCQCKPKPPCCPKPSKPKSCSSACCTPPECEKVLPTGACSGAKPLPKSCLKQGSRRQQCLPKVDQCNCGEIKESSSQSNCSDESLDTGSLRGYEQPPYQSEISLSTSVFGGPVGKDGSNGVSFVDYNNLKLLEQQVGKLRTELCRIKDEWKVVSLSNVKEQPSTDMLYMVESSAPTLLPSNQGDRMTNIATSIEQVSLDLNRIRTQSQDSNPDRTNSCSPSKNPAYCCSVPLAAEVKSNNDCDVGTTGQGSTLRFLEQEVADAMNEFKKIKTVYKALSSDKTQCSCSNAQNQVKTAAPCCKRPATAPKRFSITQPSGMYVESPSQICRIINHGQGPQKTCQYSHRDGLRNADKSTTSTKDDEEDTFCIYLC